MDAKEKNTVYENQTVISVKITDLKDIDAIFTQGYSSETIYGCLSMIAPMINPGNPSACIPNGAECLNQRKIRRELQHAERVSCLCECIGNRMGLKSAMIKQLKVSGFVHDIGKMKIDEGILSKKEKLDTDEWAEIRDHPETGYRILKQTGLFEQIADIVVAHHERWDGRGYPYNLKGNEIPLQARILTVADSYDAMTADRAYRDALKKEAALEEIRRFAGIQFDPEIAKFFCDCLEKAEIKPTGIIL